MEQLVTMRRLVKITLVLVGYAILKVDSSKDVMKEMSKTFAKPMEVCRKEMDLPESVATEFMNFWKEGYELSDRQTGCTIICLSSKLELLDADYNLHHGNAQEFAKKHGADDKMAKQLVDLIHGCSEKFPEMPDACERTLKIANCFKAEIHKLDWAPSMELIMADVLAET